MRTAAEVQPPPVAVQYAREVRARLGRHVRQIILFGSQARGDAREGSDYDFIIVVDQRSRALRKLVSEAGCELLNRTDSLCAALVYDKDQWEQVRGSPLGWNAEKEGVLL
jgi:predicted nucleotidyltransferase